MTTTYYHPRITPQTRNHEIVDQVAAALQAGHAVRLGRWRAVYDDFSKIFDIDFGSDTQENRAGAEPAGGWWAETCKEWPGEAADALVSIWLADNGGAA